MNTCDAREACVKADIFRAYDIRGVVGKDLTPEGVYQIGQAYGSQALEEGEKRVFVARDGRLSGPLLSESLISGIRSTGCGVIDLGCVPTPVLYFATYEFSPESRSGIMLTGSHNPKDHNGLKMVLVHKSVCLEAITGLYQRIVDQRFSVGKSFGPYESQNILTQYLQKITQTVVIKRPLKVVVDAGSGVPGLIAPRVFQALGCEVIALYCEVDGEFPHHHPDPSKPKNLEDLIAAVKTHQADAGLAFDGDGDRLGVVTPSGKIIWPDRQLMLYAREVLKTYPGAQIIFDVKCSQFLADVILQAGGKPLMYKTGHSLIKQKLKETGAPLAGEMSGHMFFNDKWPGFDDGIYTGARLLEILGAFSGDLDALFQSIPEGISTPELNIEVPEAEKFEWVEKLKQAAQFPDARMIDIDGMRIEFKDSWGLVRASNTTPCLVLRFEALTVEGLVQVQEKFRGLFQRVVPQLKMPF